MSGKDLQQLFDVVVIRFRIWKANIRSANSKPVATGTDRSSDSFPVNLNLHQNQCSPNWATTENTLSYNLRAIHHALLVDESR
jgi:hypothetical protein